MGYKQDEVNDGGCGCEYPYQRIIVIDDERTFDPDGWECMGYMTHLRNRTQALAWLAHEWTSQQTPLGETIDELWLDHDLGEGEDGGHEDINVVIDFLDLIMSTEYPLRVRKVYVHSQNPSGSQYVMSTLKKHWPNVKRMPLPKLVEQ